VNRAPVLTLWAAVVTERLGHPPDTALSLASAVAGTAARAKARRLGIVEDRKREPGEGKDKPAASAAPKRTVRLLGWDVSVVEGQGGVALAAGDDGKPASAAPVRNYLTRTFGAGMDEARAAMGALAASLPPEELSRVGFRLYEHFRPEIPDGAIGWGAKGELRLDRIASAGP
jgi:hypothetical protein